MSRTQGNCDPDLVAAMLDYRIANGLTQGELAARAGLSSSVISHLECDPNLRMSRTTRLKITYVLAGNIVGERKKTENTENND